MKIIRFSLLLVFFSNVCFSQQLKEKKQRRYNPTIAGISSTVLSGLGQVYCGEHKRGLLFFGGSIIGWAFIIKGVNEIDSADLYGTGDGKSLLYLNIGGFIQTGCKVWSIVDAVLIAKEKNKKYTTLSISPSLIQDQVGRSNLGVGLSLNF